VKRASSAIAELGKNAVGALCLLAAVMVVAWLTVLVF
jgi:hypothetical protein